MKWRSRIEQFLQRVPQAATPQTEVTAAVLVAVGYEPGTGRESFLLTKRTQTVKTHKGQISFPGGLREPDDPDLLCTALREAEEEVGLRAGDVQVLGALPTVHTRGALPIVPWVGYFSLPYDLRLSPDEVDRVLYLPLDRLFEEGLTPVQVPLGVLRVNSFGIWVEEELVWGATARILEHLVTGLKERVPQNG